MSDLNDGATAPDDSALFESTVGNEAEAPVVSTELPPEPPAPEPSPSPAAEPAIPPSRLREEAEARRAAERRAEALERQIAEMQPRLEPKPRTDMFENPSAFVQEEVQPILDPVQREIGSLREFYSKRDAIREHGQEKVAEAFNAMHQALGSGDPDASSAYARIKGSQDPFGDLVSWHSRNQVLAEVGSDPAAYRQKIIEEALKDPEVRKRLFEETRQQAQQSGNVITRPSISTLPSLSRVGAVALPDSSADVSDDDLWNNTTSRKRA